MAVGCWELQALLALGCRCVPSSLLAVPLPQPPTSPPSKQPKQIMDLHRDEEVTAGELYNRAMISKQDLAAEHAGAGPCCWVDPRVDSSAGLTQLPPLTRSLQPPPCVLLLPCRASHGCRRAGRGAEQGAQAGAPGETERGRERGCLWELPPAAFRPEPHPPLLCTPLNTPLRSSRCPNHSRNRSSARSCPRSWRPRGCPLRAASRPTRPSAPRGEALRERGSLTVGRP